MKQHLSHQDEKRNWDQRKLSDRQLFVADHLFEAGKTAEDQIRTGDVNDEENKGDRERRQQ